MYKLLLVCCLLFALPVKSDAKGLTKKPLEKPPTVAAGPVVVSSGADSLQLDTSKITVHGFNADSLEKYNNSPDFNYDKDTKAGLNWWDRFWQWIWELIEKLFGNGPSSAPSFGFIKYIIWAMALTLAVFIIIKLAGLKISNIFNRKSKDIQVPYTESLENIHEITFDEEIEKALNQRNYRLAVRLLYLRTLKQLSDAELIQWQLEKTNSAYLNELKDQGQKQTFGILTRQFEYVWYGDFPVDGQSYQNINTLFHDFKLMLK
jgi:hypothetical protein